MRKEEIEVNLKDVSPREQLLLFAISPGQVHGTEISKRVQYSTGGDVVLTPGTVYPVLKSLEEKGLVRCEWEGGDSGRNGARRNYYWLTTEGRAIVQKVLSMQAMLMSGYWEKKGAKDS